MKKIGIVVYLNELAHRYREIAKTSLDSKARFELESLSIEIFNKTNSLADAFTVFSSSGASSSENS